MQHAYQPSSLSRHPAIARTVRLLVAAAIVAIVAMAWAGAGRGNGWEAPRERIAVTLPAVTVVGDRSALAAIDHPVVTCERPGARRAA